MNGSETILCNLVHVNKIKMSDVKIRMKTHKLTLHCRNNDILFLRKDKYSKQACYTFKFHPEIKIRVPAKKSGTVGTVPTVPGATAVHLCHILTK